MSWRYPLLGWDILYVFIGFTPPFKISGLIIGRGILLAHILNHVIILCSLLHSPQNVDQLNNSTPYHVIIIIIHHHVGTYLFSLRKKDKEIG